MPPLRANPAFDVAVVGAGAAGQLAAIAAAEHARTVLLLEQMDRPGLKIRASGGGRCNLTNLADPRAYADAFGRHGRFTAPALHAMGPDDLRRFFERLGLPTIVCDDRQVYPATQRAADVQAALDRHLRRLGVTVRLGCPVVRLWTEAGRLKGVETDDAPPAAASRVVLACGGKSWPTLGGTGGGYALARQVGHSLVEPVPALVPLVTREPWTRRLAGVSLSGARVRIALPRQSRAGVVGDLLFTHRGLSGPAVLDLSGTVSELLRGHETVPLRVELVPGTGADQWRRRIEDWRTAHARRRVVNLLHRYLPAALGREICRQAGIDDPTTAAQLPAARRDDLVRRLAALEFAVTNTEGFEKAFVTRGGVSLREVDPDTLESRGMPGLHLAGEMLDLDGPSGGFNLQWAFASGHLAGLAVADTL